MSKTNTVALFSALCLLATNPSHAVDYSWANPVTGAYSDPTNWSPEGLPNALSLIEFNQSAPSPYTVSLGNIAVVEKIRIKNDQVVFEPDADTFEFRVQRTSNPGEITVGELDGEIGSWTIRGGTVATNYTDLTIGKEAGSTGTILLGGGQGPTAMTLSNSASPVIGKAGKGTLDLAAGATLETFSRLYVGQEATAEGELIIRGAGSTITENDPDQGLYLYLGVAGRGKLSILDGGSLDTGIIVAAQEVGSSAEVLVDGPGSELRFDLIALGGRGSATATFSNGATVRPFPSRYPSSSAAGLTPGSSGALIVTDPGTSVEITALELGPQGGHGYLEVKNGASFTTKAVYATVPGAGQETIRVDGLGTSANLGVFRLGYYGTGSMEVTGGALVTTRYLMQMAFNEGSSARVLVDGQGSKWIHDRGPIDDDIVFALAGDCSLEITRGGAVMVPATPSFYLSGSYLTGDGAAVIVDGPDSKWINGVPIFISGGPRIDPFPDPNRARIEIRNGGEVVAGRYAHPLRPGYFGIGTTVWQSGTVTIEDGILRGPLVSNMGRVENGGRIIGDFDNRDDGVLAGDGTIEGLLTLMAGSTLAPGNSPGTLAASNVFWNGGSRFEFEINSAAGTAGGVIGWDLLLAQESLELAADSSNPIVLALKSLAPDDAPGPVFDFDPAQNYSWAFATAGGSGGGGGGITGFDPSAFSVDTTFFTNDLAGGTFAILQSGNSLVLQFTSAVPEAKSLFLVGLGLLGLFARHQSSRRSPRGRDRVG